ncbi:sigma factor [Embleya sp. MST-111070]|uniref:sigma factor n=1 Tax=Embleya sp. MST-111070 TaxID=3398231 RepID=UPI003F73B163
MSSEPDSDTLFEEFVGARHGALRRTAYLLCGDWHFAEDLTQSALIKLYPKWARLRDPETAYGYARTTVVRTFIAPVANAPRGRWCATPCRRPSPGPTTPIGGSPCRAARLRDILGASLDEIAST